MKQTLNQTVEAASSYGRSKVYNGLYGGSEWDEHLQYRIGQMQVMGKTKWMLTSKPNRYSPTSSPSLTVYKKTDLNEYKYNIQYEYSVRFENLLDAFLVRHTAREKALIYVRQLNDAKLREHFLHHDPMVIAAAHYEEAQREYLANFVYKEPKTTTSGEGFHYGGDDLVQKMALWAVEVELPVNAYHDLFALGYEEARELVKGVEVGRSQAGWRILRDVGFILDQYNRDVAYALEHGETLKADLIAIRDLIKPQYDEAQLKEAREHVSWLKNVTKDHYVRDAKQLREAIVAAQLEDEYTIELRKAADLLEEASFLLGYKEPDDEES